MPEIVGGRKLFGVCVRARPPMNDRHPPRHCDVQFADVTNERRKYVSQAAAFYSRSHSAGAQVGNDTGCLVALELSPGAQADRVSPSLSASYRLPAQQKFTLPTLAERTLLITNTDVVS